MTECFDQAETSTAVLEEPDPQPAPQATAKPAAPQIQVAWIAGSETLEKFGRAIQPLAVGLLDELVRITAIATDETAIQQLPSPPVEIVRYRKPLWLPLRKKAMEAIAAELKKRKIQLLHALDVGAVDLTRRLAVMTGLKYIVSVYSRSEVEKIAGAQVRARAAVAACKMIESDLLAQPSPPAEAVRLVRPGIHQVRHATCFMQPECHTSIIAGGQLDNFELYAAVLRCFAELKQRKYDCVYFLIGNGLAERRLRALAESLQLRSELTFVDRQPSWQLPEIFRAADMYISPSAGNDYDMQSLLAMAAGVPVIAGDEGASDFLLAEKTASLYKATDVEALIAACARLLDDKAAARAQAENALEYLRRNHSPAEAVARLAAIYRQSIQARTASKSPED